MSVSTLARNLLNQHGLTDWHFKFDSAKRRAGCCRYFTKTISLSRHYVQLNTDKMGDIIDTILHEIAHALVGPGHGHGPVWRAMAIKIGAKPQRCADASIVMPKGKVQAVCNNCKKTFYRHRRPRCVYSCRKCGSELGKLFWLKVA